MKARSARFGKKLSRNPRGVGRLQDGTDRRTIRSLAARRLEEIPGHIADLSRMEKALAHVLHECETHAGTPQCPIIHAIAPAPAAAPRKHPAKRGKSRG